MSAAAQPMFLTVDAGTQSLRACLIDRVGHIHFKSKIPFDQPLSSQPGYAEYPVEAFWGALVEAVHAVSTYASRSAITIGAMGVTCQRATVIALDKHGRPLRPALLWSDQRTCEAPDSLGLIGIGMRAIGVHSTVRRFQSAAEVNYLASEEPELWSNVNKLVFLSGYLNFRLTLRYNDSVANQVGYVPFDFKRQQWARSGKWHWKALPALKRSQLPDLVPPGHELGRLPAEVAQQLNLPPDLPVIACATDKACEVLGTGCVNLHQACLSFGTAATVNVTSPRYREVDRFVPAYPAALPAHYLCEIQTHRGFWLVNWFKQEFGHAEVAQATRGNRSAEQLFDELLLTTLPGASGLVAQPYWSPGVRVPGPEARGALLGFNDTHGRAHLYRALIEGVMFSLREGLEKIVQRSGTPISCLRVAGGGASSDEVMKLAANVFGQVVERAHSYEASSIGAAICCAVALRSYPNFDLAVASMTRPGDVFEPDIQHTITYNQLYKSVYKKMYPRLQLLYRAIATQNKT